MAESKKDHAAIITEQFKRPFETVMVDIDKLSLSPNASIFRTPNILSRHNEKAYKPNAFSFGPFHFGEEQFEPTQTIKWKYLQGLLSRVTQVGGSSVAVQKQKYGELFEAVKSIEKEARDCYAGQIGSSAEEIFSEIMVLDGCFIIELFRKDANEVLQEPNDPIFVMSCLQEILCHDLILLENQIPWVVLDCLFSLTKASENESLTQLTLDFFRSLFSAPKPSRKLELPHYLRIKHILDLLRSSLILPLPPEKVSEESLEWEPFTSATKINEAGIKFKRRNALSILDIKFQNGVIEIPPLLIQETTETIFRNLISFEQCCPNYQPIVTSYAKLMDDLIDTDKDVEILCENDILDNWLNPEDAKQFFNKLYNDTYMKKFYYYDICKEVSRHRKHWWPRWRFFYVHNYFGTPWAIVSQVVGTVLLILTFLQTFYSIIGVVGGKNC